MNREKWCPSSDHCVFSENYDGRLEVLAEYGEAAVIRCKVCGFEYLQLHQRVVDIQAIKERELSHIRSQAAMRW